MPLMRPRCPQYFRRPHRYGSGSLLLCRAPNLVFRWSQVESSLELRTPLARMRRVTLSMNTKGFMNARLRGDVSGRKDVFRLDYVQAPLAITPDLAPGSTPVNFRFGGALTHVPGDPN